MSSLDISRPIGIVAGNGNFPHSCIKEARFKGCPKIVVCGHKFETDPSLIDLCDEFCWIKVGQVGKFIKFFKKHKIDQVIFTGGISRVRIFRGAWPDLTAMKILAKVGSIRDDIILRAVAKELESNGIYIFSSSEILSDFLAKKGVLTSRRFTDLEIKDVEYGWQVAKKIGSLDIGQTIVVTEAIVTAVECVEGTDQAILRAGMLTSGKKSTVVKVPKPQQDKRLDLPSIGETTIQTLVNAGCSALALEEDGAMILDPQKVINLANKNGIAIEVFSKTSFLEVGID